MIKYTHRWWWGCLLGLLVSTTSVSAKTPKFGYSGILHTQTDAWESLDFEGKKEHLEQRLDFAVSRGATVIRLGSVSPNPLSRDAIEANGERDWALADFFVQRVRAKGLLLCATLPQLVKSNGLSSYKAFLKKLLERYDGDADFGVAEVDVNKEHPDVDGSGAVTFADWGADNATKKAWAEDRVLELIEVGEQPHAAETEGSLALTDYKLQLEAVHEVVIETASSVNVMLGTAAADNQSQGTFQTRFEGLDPSMDLFTIASGAFDDAFADVSGDKAIEKIQAFFDWPSSIGYPEVERWIGSLSVGGEACVDARCDERLKSSLIVKGVMTALNEGYSTIIYGQPMVSASDNEAAASAAFWTVGVGESEGGSELMTQSQPSADIWRKLVDVMSTIDLEDIEVVPSDNPLVVGFKVGSLGWFYWYNWTRQVGPGEAYSGKEYQVRIESLTDPAVKVTTLWKGAGEQGADLASWPESVVVAEDGGVNFMVGQDVVWVTPTDAPAPPETEMTDDDLGTMPDSTTAPQPESGGCSTHQGTGPMGLGGMLLLVVLLRRRQTKRA